MTWKKRIISIVLCLCALLCAASVRADAEDAATTHTNHLVCGGTSGTTCTHAGDKHTSSQTWTAWNGGDITYDTNGIAYIYLSDDVTLQINNDFGKPKFLDVGSGKTLYLCLNGHSLTNRGSHTISVDGTLVLCDCKGSGKISHTTEEGGGFSGSDGIYVGSGAAFTMYGGTISSNNEGVQVFKGTFTMYGGKICNNNGGVLVSGGTFTMYGGEISKNKRTALDTETITYSAEGGGGVWVKDYKSWSSGQTTLGNFAMYGGKISDNEVQSKIYGGGGVCMDSDGSFYMENGTITGNKCNNSGGGLDIRCETITIKGNSTISGNTCGGDGGGIFAISSAESSITNCTISNNAATGKSSKGGGLAFQYSTFTIERCTITGNKTAGQGGGIFVLDEKANLTLSSDLKFSGNAQGCTADENGKLTGGTENDVFLHTGAYLRLASDFSKASTAPIVVTTYFTPSDNSYQKIAVDNRTTPDPTDFKYGNDDTAICTYTVTEGENKTVELRACKHSGAWKPNTDDASSGHWRKCTNCDTTETASHSGGEASCTKKAVCQVCNQPYGGLAAHDYDTTKWVKIDTGHHGHKCKNCNAIDATSKASHIWDEGTVTTPATCTTAGVKTYTCAVCSATKTERIDATGHTEVTDAAVEATCTKTGLTEGKHCSVCNTVLVAQQTVPTKSHTEVIDAAVEATCTKTGLTEGKHCSVCNTVLVAQKVVRAKGHTEVVDAAVEATCTEPGKTEGKHCSVCNTVLVAQQTVPTKSHTEVIDAAVEATCTKTGLTEGKHCSVCDTVLVAQQTVPTKSHTEVIDAAVEATCTKTGLTEGKHCSVCNTVLVAQKVVRAKGHTEVVDAAVEATCTKTGLTEGKHCSVCNAVLVAQQPVPVKAHDWGTQWISNDSDNDHHWHKCKNCNAIDASTKAPHSWDNVEVTTPATCTAAGVKTYTCTACSATKTERIDATGHAWDTKWSKDNDHHWHKCKNCNAIDTTSKAPHDWNSGTVTTPETCTTPGERTFTCTACSATKTETIPATGHAPGAAVCENKVTATCTTAGSYDEVVYCTACGNEVSRTKKTIDKLAHDYDTTKWVKIDNDHHGHKCKNCDAITDLTAHTPDRDKATETEAKVCKDCDWVIAPATHPVHTWVFVAETPATCNATGVKEHYKCDCRRKSVTDGVYDIVSDTELILAINPVNHTGAPDSKWHSDSANHWQEYTCCHARANEAAHSGGAATCTAQAVCQVCGKAYGPLAAHAWQPATCTAPKTCTACHVTDGAALGHDWGAWKVTTPATKDAPGVETRTCAHNSAHTETRSIPKLSTAVYTVSEDTKIAQIEAKVDGLDKILESDENKALVNDGKSVGVSLTVKNTASSGVSEKIKEKLAGSNLVGLRLELTVEKTVTANGVVESKQTIPDAGVLLKTTITLPAELQGKSGYVVYRLHDGNVHVLTETANENGEFISVSADKTQITICARLYSEYVIAYQAGGSSGGGYHPVNATPVKATSANTGDAGVLLYGVTAALSLTGTAWLGAKSRKH